MRGKIFTYGCVCPVCQGDFKPILHPILNDVLDFQCPEHKTRPDKYGVDGRAFKNRKGTVGRIYRNDRRELLRSPYEALRILESIRADWDKDPQRFEPSKWSTQGKATLKLSECWKENQTRMDQDRGYSYEHRKGFHSSGTYVLPILGGIDIRELVPDDIEKVKLHMEQKGLTRETIKTYLRHFRTLLIRYRDRKGILDRVPMFPERWSQRVDREQYWVDSAYQKEVIGKMDVRTRLLMELLVETGMRPGEGCALKKHNILPDRTLDIRRSINSKRVEGPTKTKRGRVVPISESLYQKLIALPVVGDSYLFTMPDGGPWNAGNLYYKFRAVCKDRRIKLYAFIRHSAASREAMEVKRKAIAAGAAKIGDTVEVAEQHYIHGEGTLIKMKEE